MDEDAGRRKYEDVLFLWMAEGWYRTEAEDATMHNRMLVVWQAPRNEYLERLPMLHYTEQELPVAKAVRVSAMLEAAQIRITRIDEQAIVVWIAEHVFVRWIAGHVLVTWIADHAGVVRNAGQAFVVCIAE